jgi:hypothetical protein
MPECLPQLFHKFLLSFTSHGNTVVVRFCLLHDDSDAQEVHNCVMQIKQTFLLHALVLEVCVMIVLQYSGPRNVGMVGHALSVMYGT